MIKFPYGLMDFEKIITNGYLYIDRTHFIEKCESSASTLFCVRPRRMGKTLWLDTLANYYDVKKKDKFNELFGNLYAGKNPTPNKNRYIIWKLDFSKIRVSNNLGTIENSFDEYITFSIKKLETDYKEYLTQYDVAFHSNDSISMTNRLLNFVELSGYKLYVLIDEYDNFTNELIATGRNEDYSQLVTGDGLLKSFFKVLKAGTIGAIDRIFVTGVTPITLADLSSSFNIATHITLENKYNSLFGFTELEVKGLLEEVLKEIGQPEKQEEYLSLMKHYYNGYTFSSRAKEHIYNPTLSIYFLRILLEEGYLPEYLYDKNLEMDINKLEHITKLSSGQQKVMELLEQNEEISISHIVETFQLSQLLRMDEQSSYVLWSYLYYHGILTFGGMDRTRTRLRIPNAVSKKFYYERIQNSFFPIRIDFSKVQEDFFIDLNVDQLVDFLENVALAKLSNRDYIQANELSMKILFLSLMMRDDLYLIDSEREVMRSYCDLLYIARADTRARFDLKDILIEFKFVKLSDTGYTAEELKKLSKQDLVRIPVVQSKLAESQGQLVTYRDKLDKHFREHNPYSKFVSDLHIHPFTLLFIGFDRVVIV